MCVCMHFNLWVCFRVGWCVPEWLGVLQSGLVSSRVGWCFRVGWYVPEWVGVFQSGLVCSRVGSYKGP